MSNDQIPTLKCLPLPSTLRLLQQRPSLVLLLEAMRIDLEYLPSSLNTKALDNSLACLISESVSAPILNTSQSMLSQETFQPPSLTESKQLSTQWLSKNPLVSSAKTLLSIHEHPGIRFKQLQPAPLRPTPDLPNPSASARPYRSLQVASRPRYVAPSAPVQLNEPMDDHSPGS